MKRRAVNERDRGQMCSPWIPHADAPPLGRPRLFSARWFPLRVNGWLTVTHNRHSIYLQVRRSTLNDFGGSGDNLDVQDFTAGPF